MRRLLYIILGFFICQSSFSQEKEVIFLDSTSTNKKYNIDLSNNLKYFSDEDYIKAYIEKDGIDELEGLYVCSANIPIRGRNIRGIYKIFIMNDTKTLPKGTNYKAYILKANCKDCSEWEKGDILAFFKKNEVREYDIYWNHPMAGKNQLVVYPDYGTKNFGSVNYAQIFITEAIVESNKRVVFSITSEFIKDLGLKKINSDESVILDRIWPESDIVFPIFSNQENDSNKDNITREKAIVLLKELKELLDLGILTQEEFDKKAEYFDEYYPFFEEVYAKKWDTLTEITEYMLKWFLKKLKINVNFLKASELNFEGKKSELVLNMCKKLNATTYIFGELGKNYADIKEFDSSKIKTIFQE